MNALDDDLRALFELQADAMPVPAPILGRPVARVTSLDARRPRRWLLAAAAVALVGAGGLALSRREADGPAAPADAPTAPLFSYQTPTVQMWAESIRVVVGDEVFVPHDVDVNSDPGDSEYTTLELEWTDAGVEQRLYVYFTSDGTQWWADEISTYGDPGPDHWITTDGQWFTSPLGTAWSGDLDLPNLQISGMTLQAFRRPDACDHPTRPLAVVFPYTVIDGHAATDDGSEGFGGAAQVIDTATCTVLDPSGYTLDASVDDPTIAVLYDSGIGANGTATTVTGASGTGTTVVGSDTATPAGTGIPAVQPLRVDLSFHAAGTTTLRLTVRDAAGAEVGTVLVPITVHES